MPKNELKLKLLFILLLFITILSTTLLLLIKFNTDQESSAILQSSNVNINSNTQKLPAISSSSLPASEAISENIAKNSSELPENQNYNGELAANSSEDIIEKPVPQEHIIASAAQKNMPDETIKLSSEKNSVQTSAIAANANTIKKSGKKLYFIIDDAGYSIENLKPFVNFPGQITIAVLPGLPNSKKSAELAMANKKTVIVHQPMEAVNGNDSGPFTIKKDMNQKTITAILEKNIAATPGVVGINNHMGSAITADERIMETVFNYLKNKKLLFIDSRTTSDTICIKAAAQTNYRIAQRDVFLDNIDTKDSIMKSIEHGLKIAQKKEYAVMIGHVWSAELANVMADVYADLIKRDFIFSGIEDFFAKEN